MNWYLQSGKDSDVVISSRIKFSRNLKDFKFNLKDRNSIEQLENKIKDIPSLNEVNKRLFEIEEELKNLFFNYF